MAAEAGAIEWCRLQHAAARGNTRHTCCGLLRCTQHSQTLKEAWHMNNMVWGAVAGAALMYFFDPDQGRRRRALLRDKTYKYFNRTSDAIEGKAEDLSNRAYGMMTE